MINTLDRELKIAIHAALEAGKVISEIYKKHFDIQIKEDKSPVTEADLQANDTIMKLLRDNFPSDGFLTEEEKDSSERLFKKRCWIVDPLDGTREFIKRNDEFTVNIALAIDHKVVLGVVYAPIFDELYYAVKNCGAYKRMDNLEHRIYVSNRKTDLHGLESRSRPINICSGMLESHSKYIKKVEKLGSSLKGCRIAEGKNDVYFNCGESMVWDTAAMECIVTEAGGILRQLNDKPILYNVENIKNDIGFYILNSEHNNFIKNE